MLALCVAISLVSPHAAADGAAPTGGIIELERGVLAHAEVVSGEPFPSRGEPYDALLVEQYAEYRSVDADIAERLLRFQDAFQSRVRRSDGRKPGLGGTGRVVPQRAARHRGA
jgi:hypothetical protein